MGAHGKLWLECRYQPFVSPEKQDEIDKALEAERRRDNEVLLPSVACNSMRTALCQLCCYALFCVRAGKQSVAPCNVKLSPYTIRNKGA